MKNLILIFVIFCASTIEAQNIYITNKDYREFVKYVQDSTFRWLMGNEVDENYLIYCETCDESRMVKGVNWKVKLDINTPWAREALEPLYYKSEERFYGRREVDTRKLIHNKVPIYPDVYIWCKDTSNNRSWATFLTRYYFTHEYFDDFPVQGISVNQIEQYIKWKYPYKQVDVTYSKKQITLSLPKEKLKITVGGYFKLYKYTRDSIIRMQLCKELDEARYCKFMNKYSEEINPPIVEWKHKIKWKDKDAIAILESSGILSKDNLIDNRRVMFNYYMLDFYNKSVSYPDSISNAFYINRHLQNLSDKKYINEFSSLEIKHELRSKKELDYQNLDVSQLNAYYWWKKGKYNGKDVFEGFIPYYSGVYIEEDRVGYVKNDDIELVRVNKLSDDFYNFNKSLIIVNVQ